MVDLQLGLDVQDEVIGEEQDGASTKTKLTQTMSRQYDRIEPTVAPLRQSFSSLSMADMLVLAGTALSLNSPEQHGTMERLEVNEQV